MAAALLLLLAGLQLLHHHRQDGQRLAIQRQQAIDLAAAQWDTLRATAYDWAHWDETHAFARGLAPGYPARNLQVASGLSSVAPVVMILDRQATVLTLQGRRGPSSWSSDPLVRCAAQHRHALLQHPRSHGISCREPARQQLWIGVIEPITDTAEREPPSGLLVLLAPLRHPSHGATLQQLSGQLEQQLRLAPPGPQELQLLGQRLHGEGGQVLSLTPAAVIGPALAATGRDLGLGLLFLLAFLGLRARLMLLQRRRQLLQRRRQHQSRQRLARARRQLDQLFAQLPLQQRDGALRQLSGGSEDPIDDLARRLEAYATAVAGPDGGARPPRRHRYRPMCDGGGRLQRLQVVPLERSGAGDALPLAALEQALSDWSSLPAGLRRGLELQLPLGETAWGDPGLLHDLQAALLRHALPGALCTLASHGAAIERALARDPALAERMAALRGAGLNLALIHHDAASDPGPLLRHLPFNELQLELPAALHPALQGPQIALIAALVQRGQAQRLRLSLTGLQTLQQLEPLRPLAIALFAGPMIGQPAADPADLLIRFPGTTPSLLQRP